MNVGLGAQVADEEARQRGLRRSLEGEAADLRAAVTALEEAARAAEAWHADQREAAQRELEGARRQVQEGELERAALRGAAGQARHDREQADSEAVVARQDAATAAGESEAARERQRETEKALREAK